MAITKGNLVLAAIHQANGRTETRRAVVICASASSYEVVYGQGEAWPECTCPVLVKKGALLGRYLELVKDTYFCDMQVIRPADVVKVFKDECLPTQLPKFEAVALEVRRRIAASLKAQATLALDESGSKLEDKPGDDSSG
jgi:hypothetical protein